MVAPETRNPVPAKDKPPHPRRWIPVSVRFLVLFLPFLGIVGFTWIAIRGYTNAVLINEIERLGGEVTTRSSLLWKALVVSIILTSRGRDDGEQALSQRVHPVFQRGTNHRMPRT
jgi:hypothetical protein